MITLRVAYAPVCDDRILLPQRPVAPQEYVLLRDLAQYLRLPAPYIYRFCRRERLIRKLRMGGARRAASYVTAYGAMRVIAFARHLQGKLEERGVDSHDPSRAAERKRERTLKNM